MDEIDAPPFLLEISEEMGAWSTRDIPGLLETLEGLTEWHAVLPYVSTENVEVCRAAIEQVRARMAI